MTNIKKFAASSVIAAMLATSATPAFAIPSVSKAAATGHDGHILEEATDYRRYRRHRRHRNRVDAGDIIAGIGILAGIAIIADAASKSNRRDRERRRERNDYPERYPQQEPAPVSYGNDIGSAVSRCSDAAERSAGEGARVDEVRSATRDGNGWRVSGDLSDNRSFDCGTSNGNVDFIQLN